MSWNLEQLEQLFIAKTDWIIQREQDCLRITSEHGLEAYVAISGEQIIAESVLFAKRQVNDAGALNEAILKTHHYFPLTSVGIITLDGDEYYAAFGALSAIAKGETIIIEVETLFHNLAGFLEAYESYLN